MRKVLLFCFLLFCTSTVFANLKEVIIFGDSLSDNGNLYAVMKVLPKSPPYYQGRFSNGPTWAEYVGNYYYNKFFAFYANYAYGGATAILHQLKNDHFIAPVILEEEIDSYLLNKKSADKSQTLFGLWIGANDYLYERSNINKLTDDVVQKIIVSLEKLISRGGKRFFVMNLPDFSQIPYARNHQMTERLGAISLMHNQKLASSISQLQAKHSEVRIVLIDIYTIFIDLLQHPEKYNAKYNKHVTDTFNSCWLGTVLGLNEGSIFSDIQTFSPDLTLQEISSITQNIVRSPELSYVYQLAKSDTLPCDHPEEHLFWDDMHPTAVVHEVLGQIVLDQLRELE